ncbi:MAG: hypothetical protein LBL94_06765 [Prevotellaceae bacterium]|jgi:very-short-patch-repair endonuclease|nr:hypothetical protein [Prevotellaceae bacterium]
METAESVKCSICDADITEGVILGFEKTDNYDILMCDNCCQEYDTLKTNRLKGRYLSNYQKCLYLALKHQLSELDVYFEWADKDVLGKVLKTVDIAIPSAKLYIEVNGAQHVENCEQLRSDLWRSYYSFNAGFLTLSVFNDAIKSVEEFYQIVGFLVDIAHAMEKRSKSIASQKRE